MDPYVGEIRIFCGNYAPVDWHLCDGTLMPVATYQVLYSLLGTVWGGDGQNTFGLPDLRGRVPIGQGPGQTPVLTNRPFASTGGAENITLAGPNTGPHTHTFNVAPALATDTVPSSSLMYGEPNGGWVFYAPNDQTLTPTAVVLNDATIAATSPATPHPNEMPSLALNYIIALSGIYPQRS